MTRINELNEITSVENGDLIPIFDVSNSETRKTTFGTMVGSLRDTMTKADIETILGYYPEHAINQVFAVDDYGADPTGVADSTTAIRAACSALQAAGGGVLRFAHNGVYRIYNSSAEVNPLGAFSAVKYIRFDGTTATLKVYRTFSNGQNIYPFSFEDCENVDLGTMNVEQVETYTVSEQFGRGVGWFTFIGYNKQIKFEYLNVLNGRIVFDVYQDNAIHTATERTFNIRGGTINASGVTGYLLSLRNNGDDCQIDRIYAAECARPFILYGVDGVKINSVLRQNASYAQAMILANSTGSNLYGYSNFTRNISVRFESDSEAAPQLDISVRGTSPCELTDITAEIHVDFTTADLTQQAFVLSAQSSAGVPDVAGMRGHKLTNIKISGIIANSQAGIYPIDLGHSSGTFNGSEIRGFSIEDLQFTNATGGTIRVDWRPFVNGIRMDGFDDANLTWASIGTNWAHYAKPQFEATLNTNITAFPTDTWTTITYDTEVRDYGGYYNPVNGRWTPPAGTVLLKGSAYMTGLLAGTAAELAISKNGAVLRESIGSTCVISAGSSANTASVQNMFIDWANGTDYYELVARVTENSAGSAIVATSQQRAQFEGVNYGR